VSNPVYGTLTVGRQDSLILDGLGRYDAMAAAPILGPRWMSGAIVPYNLPPLSLPLASSSSRLFEA
jgi:hypothetical protein